MLLALVPAGAAAAQPQPGTAPIARWSAALGAAYRLGARVQLEAVGQVERGRAGWREHRTSVRLAAFF